MAKQITQETFDAAVKENITEFEMEVEEAITDAVQQFEAQVPHNPLNPVYILLSSLLSIVFMLNYNICVRFIILAELQLYQNVLYSPGR